MSYNLIDWFIDAVDRGKCQSCKGFTLERVDDFEAQCYSCGRWYCGYDLGHTHDSLIELSTSYQREKRQYHQTQKYTEMRFEEQIAHSPKSFEDYGDYPED